LLSLVCLALATVGVPAIFPSVPSALIPQMRIALLLVGCSLAVELPTSACNGVFIGLERYEIPALTVGGGRMISALGVIAAALAGRSLVVMAAILAGANLLSYGAQYVALRRIVPDLHFRPDLVRRSVARELYGYCFGLSVMAFSMLLVNGLDLVLVGRFDFGVVAPYSVSASMVSLISGLLIAVIYVVLPHATKLHAREEAGEMGRLVINATRVSVVLLVLSGMPMLIYAKPILHLWIGQRYAASGAPLLAVLIIANMIRLVGAPYSVVLIAAGQQNYIKVSPLSEGIINLIASVILGSRYGGIGVALGTLLGSVVSVGSHLLYSMPRTRPAIDFSRKQLLVSGVLIPMLCTFPLTVAGAASLIGISIRPLMGAFATLLSFLGAGALMMRTHAAGRALATAGASSQT
jgi:O-antigen/teichoic acid export membrane protein